jgi:hypothetical protein
METARSFETSVNFCRNTRRLIPERGTLSMVTSVGMSNPTWNGISSLYKRSSGDRVAEGYKISLKLWFPLVAVP